LHSRARGLAFSALLIAPSSFGMLRNLIFTWPGILVGDRASIPDPVDAVLRPNAFEFLRFCQATRRRVFLLSRMEQSHLADQALRFEAANFFERVYFGINDERDRIADILAENDLAPMETAVISDTLRDLTMAQESSVMAIATLTGFDSTTKLSGLKPDVIVRDLDELQRLLEAVTPNDEIRIEELELMARIGVPAEERAQSQRLTVSMILQPHRSFANLDDNLARTTDYAAVCVEVRRFVSARQDKLIETLADEMAEHLLRHFAIARVELELRKFVLPETRYVAVRLTRQRPLVG
jgi:7,8-dihydroneopterin aldolase/epimerase/oxygenase